MDLGEQGPNVRGVATVLGELGTVVLGVWVA
jgi:hypothetical protein